MPRVRVKNGPNRDTVAEVGEAPLTLGRDPTCSIQIVDKGASRQHAEIFRIGEMCFIRDLQSRNGTYVNDNRIDEELLREGDRVQIGATVLVFESGDKKSRRDDSDFEFSEENFGSTLELQLEDLAMVNVGEGDGSEAQRLRALYRLGRIIGTKSEEQELIDDTLPFACATLRADSAFLFLRDPVKGNITPIGTYSVNNKSGGKVSRSIIRRAIQEKRALLTSDAMQDNRFSAQESIMMKEIRSVICVPLSVSGGLSGVLYLACDNPINAFSDEELELAAAIADQIGLAIAHIRSQIAMRENLMSTIRALVRAAEMRDPTTRGRSERVARYAMAVGDQLKLSQEQVENLQLAALLHDIGSLAEGEDIDFSEHARNLPENFRELTPAERRVLLTLEIVGDMACYNQVEKPIRFQLERNDGSGPQGMKGDEIPVSARILALAIEFDRMVNLISMEKSAEHMLKEAVVEIGRQAGRSFDEQVVKALLVAHRQGVLHTQSAPPQSDTEEVPST